MRTTVSNLAEEDIPGAALRGRNPSELKVTEFKRWLMCRGASVKGKKADLIVRYVLSTGKRALIDGLTSHL